MATHRKKLTADEALEATLDVLRECFHGTETGGAFLDPGPNGLSNLLSSLSAKEASTPIAGASIATHAWHIAFSLDAFLEWMEGVRDKEYDWPRSWAKTDASEEEWVALRGWLENRLHALEYAIKTYGATDREAAWGASGVLAHTAYHLGAIQVKIDELRKAG